MSAPTINHEWPAADLAFFRSRSSRPSGRRGAKTRPLVRCPECEGLWVGGEPGTHGHYLGPNGVRLNCKDRRIG